VLGGGWERVGGVGVGGLSSENVGSKWRETRHHNAEHPEERQT